MKEFTKKTQSVETTGKAVYVKPAMQVYEMEVEEAIMGDASGSNGADGGGADENDRSTSASRGVWGDLWAN